MKQNAAPSDPRAGLLQSWRLVHMLWFTELAVVLVAWLVLPLVVPRSGAGPASRYPPSGTMAFLFYAVGLADIGLGWWMRERAFAAARGARSALEALGRIVGPSLVVVTLAQTPAILGIVLYLGFGNRAGLSVLCVLSLIGLALHRPRLDQWQQILNAAGSHAHRPA